MTSINIFSDRSSPRHIKYLESRSELLDAALQQVEESNRRWEEARGVMEVLKSENKVLRRARRETTKQTRRTHFVQITSS